MNLHKLKEVLDGMLNEINDRPKTECEISTKWNKNQKIYFMNRILDVSGMIHCGKGSTYALDDMLEGWQISGNCSILKKLDYIYEL